MRIHNLYVDDKGETHFRDIEVDGNTRAAAARPRKPFPRPHHFARSPGSYDYEWHPRRAAYIINLDGGVS